MRTRECAVLPGVGAWRRRRYGAPFHGVGRFGAVHMLSSVSEPGLEKVAEAAPDALRIYQLYVRGDDAFVEDRVSRAIASGYTAITAIVKAELFPTNVRALGVGLPYAVTVSIFGGTVDSVALYFKNIGHESYFYWYATIVIFSSLVFFSLRH